MEDSAHARQSGNSGFILQNLKVEVLSADGQITPHGTVGEIRAKGFSIFTGYVDDKQKTARVLSQDGWFSTGDIVSIDALGYITVLGRQSDMFKRGGRKVYPSQVEAILSRYPEIQHGVVGIPDDRLGEEVCACVKPNKGFTHDAFFQWVKENFDEEFVGCACAPKYLVITSGFPIINHGKVDRTSVRLDAINKINGR